MDRKWMSLSRLSDEYDEGIADFCRSAKLYAAQIQSQYVHCPCVGCWNNLKVKVDELERHLLENGIDPKYTVWRLHGEVETHSPQIHSSINDSWHTNMEWEEDDLPGMMNNIVHESSLTPQVLESLKDDSETPLYVGCTKFTRLSAVLKLFNLKARYSWSDKSFTELLSLIKDMLPEGNNLPSRAYEAKKLLCPMGVGYKKIHACPNDCILYRGVYNDLIECPKCKSSRYKPNKSPGPKSKGTPCKVLWYLPPIPRFQRLFSLAEDAENMRWHAEKRIDDNKLRHPADSLQWKQFDRTYSEFGSDSRNLRLGPRQPGNDIDIYLAPLIEDLKILWDEGVRTFDASKQEYFYMRAMLLCTINDFPAYGNLSGYSVKGYKACPICGEDTHSVHLKNCRKIVYMGHRRFLPRNHQYRRKKAAFNGEVEHRSEPQPLTGVEVLEHVSQLQHRFGKPNERTDGESWKKRSIFFDLPYWMSLEVRHCIDVMHVEKNICESLMGTLLNIPGKTKDGIKVRLDMLDMKIRTKLAPEQRGNRTYLPPSSTTLSKREKLSLCKFLKGVKVPHGFSSNISGLVSIKDLRLNGLKSHDFHTLMQQLLPVAVRGILPSNVRRVIQRLCVIFSSLCAKVIDITELDELQDRIVVTLCELEMFFPPSFFDIMVHLTVHLVREIKILGPVYMRWMYPFERYMKVLKSYVRNKNRPEGCIVEGYVSEEAIKFCSNYLGNTALVGIPNPRHIDRFHGKGTIGFQIIVPPLDLLMKAHFYVLRHMSEISHFVDRHLISIRLSNRGKSELWVQKEHAASFAKWLKEEVMNVNEEQEMNEFVKSLCVGPRATVHSYRAYDINGYCFYTKSQDNRSVVQNSSVTLISETVHVSSSRDRNPIQSAVNYFGVIEDIWELDYIHFRVAIFKCRWVHISNVRIDEFGMTFVDFQRQGYMDEPFILAEQARQIFYVEDPASDNQYIVIHGKQWFNNEGSVTELVSEDFVEDCVPVCTTVHVEPMNDDRDEEQQLRNDHNEGIWI